MADSLLADVSRHYCQMRARTSPNRRDYCTDYMPAGSVNAANICGAGEVSVRVSGGYVNDGLVKVNPNGIACGRVVPCDGERDAASGVLGDGGRVDVHRGRGCGQCWAGEGYQTQQERAADNYQSDKNS